MSDEQKVAAVILAAGKGTRMKSAKHKVLHEIAGKPMLFHLMDTVKKIGCDKQVVVVGSGRDQIETALDAADSNASLTVQKEQLGTGHAVMSALPALKGFSGDVVILFGDTPFISEETMARMLSERNAASQPAIVVLGFEAADPGRYGRLVTSAKGLEKIVEYKDASDEERAITLCNSGMMVIDGEKIGGWLNSLSNDNAAGEYYLTDIIAAARAYGESVAVVNADEAEVMGVNSRSDLAAAEAVFQDRVREQMMAAGVTLVDPVSTFFSHDTVIANDVHIEPNVVFGSGVEIEANVTIKAFSHLEGVQINKGASVGPFARLRPGARIGENAKIGNFVEVKKADIQSGAKVSHLSYIGDAVVGEDANIGAGTITCNYDGFFKYKTEIGAGAFIGSNSALVAPVKIGDGAIVGAGSVISSEVDADALGVTRAPQKSIKGFAASFRSKRLAEKGTK
jgi:bifunctional UDP-N-acetylglucosamine pyrophosphorylase/glucosamine-1-phosphate N-acetyltransferase